MYSVYIVTKENEKMLVSYEGNPAPFKTDKDAWAFIESMMSQEDHPKFAWVKEVANANS